MRQWLINPENPERDGNRTFITNWLSRAYKDSLKTPKPVKNVKTTQVVDNKPVKDEELEKVNYYQHVTAMLIMERNGQSLHQVSKIVD